MSRTQILSPKTVRRIVTRMAYEVVERNRGADNLLVFGIEKSGVPLSTLLASAIQEATGNGASAHPLNVSAYRDDNDGSGVPLPVIDTTESDVVLVDDVLFTGRTVRAALDAVVDLGRPRSIQLAILIDRGHREVPIQPDVVGRVIPTKHEERIDVDVSEPAVYLVE